MLWKYLTFRRKDKLRKFILSKSMEVNKCFFVLKTLLISSEETGFGDVSYNTQRNILGALPVTGKIAYHLYNNGWSDHKPCIELLKKSKWHSHNSESYHN